MTILRSTDHSDILVAYIKRLSLADLERIVEAQRACWHAAMNLGMRTQIECQNNSEIIIRQAADNMIEHDKQIIERVVLKSTSQLIA